MNFAPLPDKLFDVVYADPPWAHRDGNANGKRGAKFKYPVLPAEQIARLPVWDIAAENSLIFLWVPDVMIEDGIFVMRVWGFKFIKIGFSWAKKTKFGKWHFGTGHYTRGNPEYCLLGKRGRPLVHSKSESALIVAPKGKHSEKPDEARQRVARIAGPKARKIELFARESADGWTAWGDQL